MSYIFVSETGLYCGFKRITDSPGVISAPDADGVYPNNVDCTWYIIPHQVKYYSVQINVTYIDIEYHDNCTLDSLQVC